MPPPPPGPPPHCGRPRRRALPQPLTCEGGPSARPCPARTCAEARRCLRFTPCEVAAAAARAGEQQRRQPSAPASPPAAPGAGDALRDASMDSRAAGSGDARYGAEAGDGGPGGWGPRPLPQAVRGSGVFCRPQPPAGPAGVSPGSKRGLPRGSGNAPSRVGGGGRRRRRREQPSRCRPKPRVWWQEAPVARRSGGGEGGSFPG